MKKSIPISLSLLVLNLTACNPLKPSDKTTSSGYEFAMISSGDNFPSFDPMSNDYPGILLMLHQGKTKNEIREHFNWDENTLNSRISVLKEANFIRMAANGKLVPNVFVCRRSDGEEIYKKVRKIGTQIADSIEHDSARIAQEAGRLNAFRFFKFGDISLLILSNVLLDNWQIQTVEEQVLKSPRTLHHGRNYYASYQEKSAVGGLESFGIYGNQVENAGNFSICRYGNSRYSKEVMALNQELKKEFTSSHSIHGHSCPILENGDLGKLQEIADSFSPMLLGILNQNKGLFLESYRESAYFQEISFEEYFIWVYHFVYTAATDELISRKVIKLPDGNTAFYIMKNE